MVSLIELRHCGMRIYQQNTDVVFPDVVKSWFWTEIWKIATRFALQLMQATHNSVVYQAWFEPVAQTLLHQSQDTAHSIHQLQLSHMTFNFYMIGILYQPAKVK